MALLTELRSQTGTGSVAMTLPTFTAPALPAGVTAAAPGALSRIFALVQSIKNSGKCTDAIGEDLGIIGSVAGGPDLNAVAPIIAATVSGGAVHIQWGYNGNRAWLSGCEIQVDRGDAKGYGLLMVDTTPNYTWTPSRSPPPGRSGATRRSIGRTMRQWASGAKW